VFVLYVCLAHFLFTSSQGCSLANIL